MSKFPYAELLEFNQPNPIRKPGFTRIRDAFEGLSVQRSFPEEGLDASNWEDYAYFNDPERIVEFAGRWDYGEKNARRLGETVAAKYRPTGGQETNSMVQQIPIIQKYIDMGHESMLEVAWATFFLECTRVVSHEIVRHRLASYQQESQRFVKYDTEDWPFYIPEGLERAIGVSYQGEVVSGDEVMEHVYATALEAYKSLREQGVAPQLARYVLPNGMRTRIVMSTNLREWRHICKLRLDSSAQPEMQALMQQIYDQLVDVFPNVMYNALEGERGVR